MNRPLYLNSIWNLHAKRTLVIALTCAMLVIPIGSTYASCGCCSYSENVVTGADSNPGSKDLPTVNFHCKCEMKSSDSIPAPSNSTIHWISNHNEVGTDLNETVTVRGPTVSTVPTFTSQTNEIPTSNLFLTNCTFLT